MSQKFPGKFTPLPNSLWHIHQWSVNSGSFNSKDPECLEGLLTQTFSLGEQVLMQLSTCRGSTHPGLETLCKEFHLCIFFSCRLQTPDTQGLPWWLSHKEFSCQSRRRGFTSWIRKIPLEKKMTRHFSILAWEIPWTEEPGGLRSMGLQKSQTRLSN